MIRALAYLLALGALVAVAVWIAERPGAVAVTWQGYRVDTTVGVLALGVLVLLVVAGVIHRFWRGLWGAPRALARQRRERRRGRGYRALTQGMVAVAAGDAEEAARQARRAGALLSDPPLTLLLSAQTAQLEGDEAAAERYFTAMLERPETEFLGLRGLLNQASRTGDAASALALARRAHRLRPGTPWVLTTLLELELRAGEWAEAEKALDEAIRCRVIETAEGRRGKAIVRHQSSRAAAEAGDRDGALELARKAHEIGPGLIPATVHYTRLLVAAGRDRRAAKVIEDAWSETPHPDLVAIYARARPAADALGWVQTLQQLSARNPEHPESRLALAEAALAAELWGAARRELDAVLGISPTARACRLRARLEEAEHGDGAAARAWLARAAEAAPDAAWVCDGCGAAWAEWQPVCPRCEAVDELVWRHPERVVSLAPQEHESGAIAPPRPARAALPPAPSASAASA